VISEGPRGASGTWRDTVARFGGRSHWVDLSGPLHYAEFTPDGHRHPDDSREPAQPPAAVLVHGLGGSFVDWLALAPLLARQRRVLVLDLPGHGLSPASGRRLGLVGLAGLLNRFVLATGAGQPLLVGNSLGGALAALQASSWPGATSGLVLIDPVLPVSPRVRPHSLVVAGFAAYAIPGIGRRVLGRRRALVPPDLLIAETIAFVCGNADRVPADVVAAGVQLAEHRRLWPPDDVTFLFAARDILRSLARPSAYRTMLGTIEAPVLLLHGTHDRFVPVEAARRIAGAFPGWHHVLLPGAGHLPQLEAAPAIADLITSWQERTAPPQHPARPQNPPDHADRPGSAPRPVPHGELPRPADRYPRATR
jgi:pimeloyl-ACP methyl ester carboxylesterase